MTNYFNKIEQSNLSLRGKLFSVSFTASVASLATANLQIKTSTKACIITDWEVGAVGQPITAVALESPTITNGTTLVPSYNFNRATGGSAVTLFYSDPTNISGGTTILTQVVPAEKGSSGATGDSHQWVLKKNTSYVWQITNNGNNTATVFGHLVFIESVLP